MRSKVDAFGDAVAFSPRESETMPRLIWCHGHAGAWGGSISSLRKNLICKKQGACLHVP